MKQVGDYVTVKKLLPVGNYGMYNVITDMQRYAGRKARIVKVLCEDERSGGGCYKICIDYEFAWTDKMFERDD